MVTRALELDAQERAGAGRPESRTDARRHRLHRPAAGRRAAGDMARGVSGGHRRTSCGVADAALCAASGSTPSDSASRTSSRRRAQRPRCCGSSKPRPRPLRATVGDARLRPARPDVSAVSGDYLPRGARLLPQVPGRRAHAADDPQPRAAGRRRRRRIASASRRCCRISAAPELLVLVAAASRRRQVARRRPSLDERAHGARHVRAPRPVAPERATSSSF